MDRAGPVVSPFFHLKNHCTHLWAFEGGEWVQSPVTRQSRTKACGLVTPHTNTIPVLVGCGGEWHLAVLGPTHLSELPVALTVCSFHLTDRTSFPTKHREGPAKVITHCIGYGDQDCHSCSSTRVPEEVTLLHLPVSSLLLGSQQQPHQAASQ